VDERAHIRRRDLQKDETRWQILNAARDLLREQGFGAMSTRAVAERAGVGVGTVFLHFRDKGALVEALLHDQIEAALDGALATLPAADLADQLVHVAGRLFAAYEANAALSRVFLRESLFIAAGVGGVLAPQLHRFEEWTATRITEAAARGEIAPVDARLGFAAFFSFYLGVLIAGLRGDLSPATQVSTMEALVRRHFGLE
jgi:AcrR family transcriptional regulator